MQWTEEHRSVTTLRVCVSQNLTTFRVVPRKGRNPSSCRKAEIGHGEFLFTGDFYPMSVSYCRKEKSKLCHILSLLWDLHLKINNALGPSNSCCSSFQHSSLILSSHLTYPATPVVLELALNQRDDAVT